MSPKRDVNAQFANCSYGQTIPPAHLTFAATASIISTCRATLTWKAACNVPTLHLMDGNDTGVRQSVP